MTVGKTTSAKVVGGVSIGGNDPREGGISRMRKNSFSPRLIKTVQMPLDLARDHEPVEWQGGAPDTHPEDGSRQMGPVQQPVRRRSFLLFLAECAKPKPSSASQESDDPKRVQDLPHGQCHEFDTGEEVEDHAED